MLRRTNSSDPQSLQRWLRIHTRPHLTATSQPVKPPHPSTDVTNTTGWMINAFMYWVLVRKPPTWPDRRQLGSSIRVRPDAILRVGTGRVRSSGPRRCLDDVAFLRPQPTATFEFTTLERPLRAASGFAEAIHTHAAACAARVTREDLAHCSFH